MRVVGLAGWRFGGLRVGGSEGKLSLFSWQPKETYSFKLMATLKP